MVYRGKIIKENKKENIVLTKDYRYMKIKRKKGSQIGKEIIFTDDDIISGNNKRRIKYSVIAALMIFIVGAFIYNNIMSKNLGKAYAIVSLDINPSVEFEITEGYSVKNVSAINEEGNDLIIKDMIGMDINEAVKISIEKAIMKKYLTQTNNVVLISRVQLEESDDVNFRDNIVNNIKDNIKEENMKIIYVEADKEDYANKEDKDISIGKYQLYKNMVGDKENIKNLKSLKVSDILEIKEERRKRKKEIKDEKEEKKESRKKEKEKIKNKEEIKTKEERRKKKEEIKDKKEQDKKEEKREDKEERKETKEEGKKKEEIKDKKEEKRVDKGNGKEEKEEVKGKKDIEKKKSVGKDKEEIKEEKEKVKENKDTGKEKSVEREKEEGKHEENRVDKEENKEVREEEREEIKTKEEIREKKEEIKDKKEQEKNEEKEEGNDDKDKKGAGKGNK